MKSSICLVVALGAVAAHGQTVLFVASGFGVGGTSISASAKFVQTGTNLHVTLTNTGGSIADPGNLLSSLFFQANSGSSAAKVIDSVQLASGSSWIVESGGSDPTLIQRNQGYGFKSGINGTYGTISNLANSYGFSAVGLGIFNAVDAFHSGAPSLDGDDYGLAPSAGVPSGPSFMKFPYAKNAVEFDLTVANFNVNQIDRVLFHYGSGTEFSTLEGGYPPVPEPATMGLIAAALGVAARKRRK